MGSALQPFLTANSWRDLLLLVILAEGRGENSFGVAVRTVESPSRAFQAPLSTP